MTMFSAGQKSKALNLTLDSLVVAENWGEIWRCRQENLGHVFLLAYQKEQGKKLFEEAREALEKWQQVTASGASGFLKIHQILGRGQVPLLMIENPQGKTVREFFSSEERVVVPSARMALSCAKAICAAKSYGLAPLGFSPDTIVQDAGNKEAPWRLMPVLPGLFSQETSPGDGRYTPQLQAPKAPPEQKKGADLWSHEHAEDLIALKIPDFNTDVFTLSWIWAEAALQDFECLHEPQQLKDRIHFPRLKMLIQNGLSAAKNGVFTSPDLTEIAITNWLKREAVHDREDYEAYLEEEKAKELAAQKKAAAKSFDNWDFLGKDSQTAGFQAVLVQVNCKCETRPNPARSALFSV